MIRLLLMTTMLVYSSAHAAPVRSVELVSFDNRPEGSEWMGTFNPPVNDERQDFEIRKWADEARQHLRVDARPAVVRRTSEEQPRRESKPRRTGV